MAAGLCMNATVSFNSVALTDVRSMEVNRDGERVTQSADVDTFLTFQAVVKRDRRVTVRTDNPGALLGLSQGGTAQTLSCVLNGAGSAGDVTCSGSAMCLRSNGGADHASPDHGGEAEFGLVSSDGATDPLTVSAA